VFQACSISKHLTAVAALRLVREGRLSLDADIREYLPGPPVTLRQLLSHTAGLNRAATTGYPRDIPPPAARDLLADVRPELPPGVRFRYSGTHYLLVQHLLTEVTGQPFDALMHDLVLAPVGMVDSSFDQSFPLTRPGQVALGHAADGTPEPDGWRVYPELAASGLWTTPTDLARLSCAILRAAAGTPGQVLSAELANELARPVTAAGYGLGSIAVARAGHRWFGHAGDHPAYQCLTVANLDDGSGVTVMANLGGDLRFILDLLTDLEFSVPQAQREDPRG
jgi:CubicO group peptidase (beta-lactamase class C family)